MPWWKRIRVRPKYIVLTGLALSVIGGCYLLWKPGMKARALKDRAQEMAKSRVRPGEIEEWLRSEELWVHRRVVRGADDLDRYGHRTIAELAGLVNSEVGTFVCGETSYKELMSRKRLAIYFLFDKEDKFLRHFVVEDRLSF